MKRSNTSGSNSMSAKPTYGTEKPSPDWTSPSRPALQRKRRRTQHLDPTDGVTVDCGYVRQEQEYHQYEIEKAKQAPADNAFDVFEDFEFERKQ